MLHTVSHMVCNLAVLYKSVCPTGLARPRHTSVCGDFVGNTG
ncbi:hypothetical protein F383_24427 [Gossypium arboreum]|uniref:Uncharacterized protein n=1 Tax=Gossypium arboreum TaxID=29729 RepID=A0A0B0NJY5_GOSAR|nr:hypothetical protein F383_12080 [Gossypium arboreum]KHG19686.1 hypothetical protein F383_24427 [Gossypium arboreum]